MHTYLLSMASKKQGFIQTSRTFKSLCGFFEGGVACFTVQPWGVWSSSWMFKQNSYHSSRAVLITGPALQRLNTWFEVNLNRSSAVNPPDVSGLKRRADDGRAPSSLLFPEILKHFEGSRNVSGDCWCVFWRFYCYFCAFAGNHVYLAII